MKNNIKGEIMGNANQENSKYWQDVENKVIDVKELSQEFRDDEFDSFSVTKSRRNFLKIMGFTVSTMPLAGCIKIPVRKAIPYLNKAENQVPGVANYYASTFMNTPIVVKTREGRPIFVKGNDKSKFTQGGVNAQAIASVLSLYDSNRLRSPEVNSSSVEWSDFDSALKAEVDKIKASRKDLVILTDSNLGPSKLALIDELKAKFGVKHIVFDPANSRSVEAQTLKSIYNQDLNYSYDFSNPDLIISFGADFLGTWGDDVVNTKQFMTRRNPDANMNKHIQFESIMSLTGTNADIRYTRSIKDQREVMIALCDFIDGKKSQGLDSKNIESAKSLYSELKRAKSSLLISGDTCTHTQSLIHKINQSLGNFGKSIFLNDEPFRKHSSSSLFEDFIDSMVKGQVGAVFFDGVNPAYSYYNQARFSDALSKVSLKLSFASSEDETSKLCNFKAPKNHVLESWGDSYNGNGEFSLIQPMMQPLFGSRMAEETLLKLLGKEETYYDYIKINWNKKFFARSSGFENFWNQALHDGVTYINGFNRSVAAKSIDCAPAIRALKSKKYDGLNIVTYQKYGIRNGEQANNPWLQELPDPVTKATWDNYIMISPIYAKEKSIKSGDVLEIKSESHSVKLPAIVQPGVDKDTIGIAIGYGRKVAGKVAMGLGANAYPFMNFVDGVYSGNSTFVTSVSKTGAHKPLAQTQTHHSMEARDIVRETTFTNYTQDKASGNMPKMKLAQIYPGHDQGGHQWAMAIDMNTCTGCSSCIISCNSENNVPVVGRAEVANRREMHWLRLDRYYAGDENEPETVHMPMLCQHCENAPCENVCPVLATVHSSDGLNQMIYNRCVGTRYCANNCPYKVRRFNWFNYDHSDDYARLALNPDITVRSRGVMEKCSFCVQRIQEGKLNAKKERRALKDGDIKTACQQGCPSDAITFGDMNDKNSKIAQMIEHNRRYTVLEELNVKSRVSYMVKVRNK